MRYLNVIRKAITENNYLLFIFSVVAFFITVGVTLLAGHAVDISFSALTYCIVLVFVLDTRPMQQQRLIALSILMLPVSVTLLPIHIIHFKSTLASLPSLVAYFIGAGFGLLIFYRKKQKRVILFALLLIICIFSSTKGFSLWLNKQNFGTYFSYINESVPTNIDLKDISGANFNVSKSQSQILIFDFWNTGCGICFKKFPILKEKIKAYSSRTNVQFYTVNVRLKRDTVGEAPNTLRLLKYNFQQLKVEDVQAAKNIGVLFYPTVLIIYKGRIIYRGDIENIDPIIKSLL